MSETYLEKMPNPLINRIWLKACQTGYQYRYLIMKIVLGSIIVILGFISPFLSNGKIPPAILFWIGFLLLLMPDRKFPIKSNWANWGRIGLLINIIIALIGIVSTHIILNTKLAHSYLAGKFISLFYWIAGPINQLLAILVPYPRINLPNGMVGFQIHFTRSILTAFFDIVLYVFLAIVIGEFFLKYKKNHSNKKILFSR